MNEPRSLLEHIAAVLVGRMLYTLVRFMMRSTRVISIGQEDVLRQKRAGRRILFVSWHGYDLCNLGVFPVLFGRDARGVIMAPDTWGGKVMEQLAAQLNYNVIPMGPDSSSPLWTRAVVKMSASVKGGRDGLIAVDGPSGPAHQVKLGAAVIARRSGAVVVPTAVAGSRAITMRNRWDKHLVVPPLSRMIVHFGPLIDTQPDDGPPPSAEVIRDRIQTALIEGTKYAQALSQSSGSHA